MNKELKQCPFCASDMVEVERFSTQTADSRVEFAVCCRGCGASGPNDLGRSGAIEMWNLRCSEFPGMEK